MRKPSSLKKNSKHVCITWTCDSILSSRVNLQCYPKGKKEKRKEKENPEIWFYRANNEWLKQAPEANSDKPIAQARIQIITYERINLFIWKFYMI